MIIFCEATDCESNEDKRCQRYVHHMREELRFPAVCDDYSQRKDEEESED